MRRPGRPAPAGALGAGLRATTISSVLAVLLYVARGRIPFVCAGPDLAYTPFLAVFAARVSGAAGGAEVDSELRFLVLTYLLLDARNASSIMFWIDDIIRCCWGMEAAPAFAVPSLRRCIWNSQVGSPGFGWW